MNRKFILFGSPKIEEDEIAEVESTLRSGWIGTGPKVSLFEKMFKDYKGAGHGVAVNSCTAALHLSLLSLDLKPGDEVITSPLTFCASVNAIIHAGATPVLADCETDTMNIDPLEIRRKITSRTRAILPVHFAGRPCNMQEILKVAREHDLKVVEDCAHAIEAEYHGKKIGTLGDIGCFSFYVTKNIITGEGGMVITGHEEYADKIKVLALHGMNKDAWKRFGDDGYKHYQVVFAGFKYNMTDIQAAIGIHQLKRIDAYWQRRGQIWDRYQAELTGLPLTLPMPPDPNTRHAYHLFTILIDQARVSFSRDAFLDEMTRQHIGVGVHYLSIPEHPYYQQKFGWNPEDFPCARNIGQQTVSIPLSPKLTDEDLNYIISSIKRVIKK